MGRSKKPIKVNLKDLVDKTNKNPANKNLGVKIIDTDVKNINDEYVNEKIKIPKTPKNPKNMALPKGVKSPVDYTKLFLSQELEGETLDEKALSKSQQRFMGMVYSYLKGEMPNASDEVKEAAKGMSKKDAKKYASTKHAKLPEKVISDDFIPEVLDKKDVPHIKNLIKKLKDGSELHAKQSKDLEVALKTEEKVDEAILPALMLAAKIGGGIMLAKKILDRKKKKKQEIIVRNEETAIESELLIQDWNKDDIKFTEVEAIDIIKPEPLKPSPSNWRHELDEDWQKVNRKDKTDGLSRKAVKAYRRENPGSKLQTAVTTKPSKLKKGSKSAKRRLSFCRRMKGMKKKLTSAKTRRDPDSRINKALRRWNC